MSANTAMGANTAMSAGVAIGADSPFTGLFVPLITPFTDDGELAPDALGALARHVLDQGATGIVALGTTAETPTLTESERSRILDICAGVCEERSAVLIAGTGSNDTARSIEALERLERWPHVGAALSVVPYYSRPGEAGVIEHFSRLAQASPVPLIIYNIPYRTGQTLSWAAVCQIAALPNVAGVKHAVGGIDVDTVAMMAARPPGFSVLAGDDVFASALLGLGAQGAILASAHVATSDFARLVEAWRTGCTDAARPLGHKLTALAQTLFAEPNPTVIKGVLHALRLIPSPAVRLPLLPASDASVMAALAVG